MKKNQSYLFLVLFLLSIFYSSVITGETYYKSPGIVAPFEGNWVGSDHLFNLSNKLDVTVEILKPSNVDIAITEESIKNRITKTFEQMGILPEAEEKEPPLPFFHMLVMVYPIENGYAVYCDGRLFEQVEIDRINLPEDTTFQAITWERQNLILAPQNRLAQEINNCVDDITKSFTERFQFFKNLRTEDKENN